MNINLSKKQVALVKPLVNCSWCGERVNMTFDKNWALFANVTIKTEQLTQVSLLCPYCAEKFYNAIVSIKAEVKNGKA